MKALIYKALRDITRICEKLQNTIFRTPKPQVVGSNPTAPVNTEKFTRKSGLFCFTN
jgi:hypothetical protein